MYRPIIRLNTNICKICNKVFKSEKALKDHIFNKRVNDKNHTLFKKELRKKRFENAKLVCPVCGQKIFRCIKTHFNYNKDKKHNKFLKEQEEFILKKFNDSYSYQDIANIKNKFTNDFSSKYIAICIINLIGKSNYKETSKIIFSKKRKDYWKKFSIEQRKRIMEKVRNFQWGDLTSEQRRNHPWVVTGRIASLESSKRGSKNQKHAYNLLLKKIPNFNWVYNYAIDNDWHVDIACPEKRIFIEWDGRHHRIPIHGTSYLNNRKNRDKVKDKIITNKLKGIIIRVKDDGRENLGLVEQKVQEIKKLIFDSLDKPQVIYI